MPKNQSPKPPLEASSTKQGSDRERLLELIDIVLRAAKKKGWHAALENRDEEDWNYATISVSRVTPGSYERIEAFFEITCEERIRITYNTTSLYDWGLAELQEAIRDGANKLSWFRSADKAIPSESMGEFELIQRFLRKFRQFARQLQQRHGDREPFVIKDEYDVQDLLHAVLRGLFDDVRPEEVAPSYAGGSSRMDLLLKAQEIVIEVKFANNSLRDRQIGEQLIIDIARYQSHPNCKRLICFVYDPNGYIKNPVGIENDLSKKHGDLLVKVVVISM